VHLDAGVKSGARESWSQTTIAFHICDVLMKRLVE
jgi:hypothetical protein